MKWWKVIKFLINFSFFISKIWYFSKLYYKCGDEKTYSNHHVHHCSMHIFNNVVYEHILLAMNMSICNHIHANRYIHSNKNECLRNDECILSNHMQCRYFGKSEFWILEESAGSRFSHQSYFYCETPCCKFFVCLLLIYKFSLFALQLGNTQILHLDTYVIVILLVTHISNLSKYKYHV